MRQNSLVALLALVLAHARAGDLSSSGPSQVPPGADPGFDLLLLVRTWPPTFCESLREQREICSAPPLQDFTLHGLWPEYSTGGWPQFCKTDAIDDADTASAAPDDRMRCEWPSFRGTAAGFWDHEWSKHGTCAAPLLGNRTQFMATALSLHERFDLNAVLSAAGVWPADKGRQGTFPSSDAAAAVRDAWGVEPRLACHKGSLAEVWMCLNLDLEPVECPTSVHPAQRCGAQFRMPPGAQVAPECRRFFPPGAGGGAAVWWAHWPLFFAGLCVTGVITAATTAQVRRRRSAAAAADYTPLPA